jgi:hypothetical protein
MAFPNMAIPRQQMIGRFCDISSKNKSANILESARNREWEDRISVGRQISSPLAELLGAGASHETANWGLTAVGLAFLLREALSLPLCGKVRQRCFTQPLTITFTFGCGF